MIYTLAALCALQTVVLLLLNHQSSRERKDLYDRIQAGTFAEYTRNRRQDEVAKKQPDEDEDVSFYS